MNYDLIIIGGGPAGMTAGIYASRQRIKTLLITPEFGGQMAKKSIDVENYPGFEKISGFDLIKKFKSHLENSKGVKIEIAKVSKVSKKGNVFTVETENNKAFKSKAIIVATGAEPRILNVKGEKEFMGKGVSYCPVCDGPIFKGKNVAVIGGGQAGCEAATLLLNYAGKIYILEYSGSFKSNPKTKEILEKSGKVEFITNAELKEVKGDVFVKSLVYNDLKSKKEKELDVSGVFVEIGYKPANSFVDKNLVDFTPEGEIKIGCETCEAKTSGFFAAGDVSGGKCKQIVVAASDGAKAALAVVKFLNKNNGN